MAAWEADKARKSNEKHWEGRGCSRCYSSSSSTATKEGLTDKGTLRKPCGHLLGEQSRKTP